MTTFKSSLTLKLLFVIFSFNILLSACSKDTSPPEERAVTRWTSIINKDWESAYKYETPNYRKTYDSQTYRNSFGGAVDWIGVKLISITKPEKNLADVKLEITTTFSEAGNLPIPGIITERWQLIDGQWWHIKK